MFSNDGQLIPTTPPDSTDNIGPPLVPFAKRFEHLATYLR